MDTLRHLPVGSLDHTGSPTGAPTPLSLGRSQGLPLLVTEGRMLLVPMS